MESESTLVTKGPCPDCGSSDALALYDDGHTHCYSCNKTRQNVEHIEEREAKPKAGLINIGQPRAWKARALTAETCKKWSITVSQFGGEDVRVFNYRDKDHRVVAQKIRPRDKSKMKFLGNTKEAGLYGKHLWRSDGRMVVITEGEIDAASVSQAQGHKWPVVSLKNGAGGSVRDLRADLEWLSKFQTVVLWFDMDDPGRKAVADCAPLFKPGQCKIVTIDQGKDANELLVQGRTKEIIDAIWSAKEYRPDGIVAGSDLWGTLTTEEETFSLAYPWRGIQEKTLGCRLGEVVTLTAGSGIGKSSLVRELAYSLISQGEHVGLLMFEETVKRTALGIMGIHANKNFTLINNPHKEGGFEEAYKATVGNGRVFLYDHFGSTAIDNVLDRCRYLAKACGVRWLFIDHLSILISGMEEGDERRLIDNAMTAIKTMAMECNVGVFLVSHLKRPTQGKGHEDGAVTSLSQLRGSHAIAQLSDIVIGVERNQQDMKYQNITTLRVLKNRFTGDAGIAGWLLYQRSTGRLEELLDDPFQDEHFEAEEHAPEEDRPDLY